METFRKISLIQRNLVLMFYIIFCLALVFPVWMLFTNLEIPSSVNILVIVMMVLVFVFIGSYFYLIVCLPDRLSRNFDVIRNDVASGKIKNEADFAKRINDFLIKQFNFIFLDIEYSAVGIMDSKKIYYTSDFPKAFIEKEIAVFNKTSLTEDVIYEGYKRYLDKRSYKYIIPIYFGNKHLGFIYILTNRKLNVLFKGILADFEDFYVDDQLLHVLNNQKK